MQHLSNSQHLLRWFAFGFALIIAATIALLTTSPSIAYTTDLNGNALAAMQNQDPQTDAEPWESPVVATEARNVLANRLSVLPGDLELVSQEAVRWPDTSLGCPEPGYAYAKVMVPGYRFTFSYDGSFYEVHTAYHDGLGLQQPAVSCEGGLAYPA
jgi:hypothetical protein